MDSTFDIETLSLFVNGEELVDFGDEGKVEFEYSRNLSDWKTVTVPVDTGSYFLRIKSND